MSDLIQRLRGNYTIPIRDGAGPLNGSMEFRRDFPTVPIQLEAADALEAKDAEIAALRERMETLREMRNRAGGVLGFMSATYGNHATCVVKLRRILDMEGE